MKHNVNLVALGSGLSMGFLGNSHFGLEDIAIMRTIPNLNIICPSDCLELGKILDDCAFRDRGPSYIRLTGIPGSKSLYEKDYKYKFGKNTIISKGSDVLILSHGSILGEIKSSLEILNKKKISAKVINISSIKPIDKNISNIIKKFRNVITIEEHTSMGGLGMIISEIIAKHKINTNLRTISLPDKFGPTGNYDYLLNHYGLNSSGIAKEVSKFIKKK